MKFRSGVLHGEEVTELLNYANENDFALPAVNVVNTSSVNAVLQTAKEVNSPVIIQFSNGGASFNAGKGLNNDNQNDKDDTTKMQIGKMMKNVSQSEFQNKFNNLFEKNMVKKVDESRNDWFKNEDAMYTNSAKGNMGGAINDVKQKQNSLIRYNGVQTIQSNNGGNLYDEDDDSYICSDPFSKLKYDDLRKVHKNETVFAVSENDNYKTYNSMDEYRQVRGSQSLTPMEESQARTVLRENNSNYEKMMMQKQYDANLQTMKNEEKNKSILSNFLRITD